MNPSDQVQPDTESTPLLHNATIANLPPTAPIVSHSRPGISACINYVHTHGLEQLDANLEPIFSHFSTNEAERLAYELIVLCVLYSPRHLRTYRGNNVWETWSNETRTTLERATVEERITVALRRFSSSQWTNEELEQCLWTPFPLEDSKSSRLIRVVDVLKNPDVPPVLLMHRLIMASLLNTWSHGWTRTLAGSVLGRVDQFFTTMVTPKVIHALDLTLHLVYLATLSHYVLYPPPCPTLILQTFDINARDIALTIYSVALACRLSTYFVPGCIVASAFLFTLPEQPTPGGIAYGMLLVSIIMHILLLHLPRTPSPIFLLEPGTALPLSTLLFIQSVQTIAPILLYYIPGLLVALYLLFESLKDDWFTVPPAFIANSSVQSSAAPMETREAFLALSVLLLVMAILSTIYVMLHNSRRDPSSIRGTTWDRYSQQVRTRARQIFISTLVEFSPSRIFLPPFNLLQLLFVDLPMLTFRLYGLQSHRAIAVIESVLWWWTVGPCALVLAACRAIFLLPHVVIDICKH